MSYSWKDLCSKSDVYYNTLPLFNKKKQLEDNYSFKFTAKPSNGVRKQIEKNRSHTFNIKKNYINFFFFSFL